MVKKLIISGFLFFFVFDVSFASVIKFLSGKTVEAEIVEKTDSLIKLNEGGVILTYSLDKIDTIDDNPLFEAPKESVSQFRQGLNLAAEKNWPQAKSIFQESLNAARYSESCFRLLKIIESFEKGEIDQQIANLLVQAEILVVEGRPYRAVEEVKAALTYPQKPLILYCCLAAAQISALEYEDALLSLTKVVTMDPSYSYAYNDLGLVCNELGRYREAISYFAKAIDIDSDCYQAYNNLGLVYTSLGQTNNALVFFGKAIEKKSDYAKAYRNLGLVYADIGLLEHSREKFEKAKELFAAQNNAYELEQTNQYILQIGGN